MSAAYLSDQLEQLLKATFIAEKEAVATQLCQPRRSDTGETRQLLLGAKEAWSRPSIKHVIVPFFPRTGVGGLIGRKQ